MEDESPSSDDSDIICINLREATILYPCSKLSSRLFMFLFFNVRFCRDSMFDASLSKNMKSLERFSQIMILHYVMMQLKIYLKGAFRAYL